PGVGERAFAEVRLKAFGNIFGGHGRLACWQRMSAIRRDPAAKCTAYKVLNTPSYHSGIVRRTRPGISSFRVRCSASPRNDKEKDHAGNSYPIAASISMVRRTAGRAIIRA